MTGILSKLFSKGPKKFFSYRNRTLDVSGLKVGLENIPNMPNVDVGKLKLTETQTKVKDELVRLDLLQYSLSQDLNKITDDAVRDQLLQQIITAKISMLGLVSNQDKKTETSKKKELIPEIILHYYSEMEKFALKEDQNELISKISLIKERIKNKKEPYFTINILDDFSNTDIYEQEKFNILKDKLHEETYTKLEVTFLPYLHNALEINPEKYHDIILNVLNSGMYIVPRGNLKIDAWGTDNRNGFSFWISEKQLEETIKYNEWDLNKGGFTNKLYTGFYGMSIFPESILLETIIPKYIRFISEQIIGKKISLLDAQKMDLSSNDLGLG